MVIIAYLFTNLFNLMTLSNLDYVFYDFKKKVFLEWDYETGIEEPEILGSGSSYHSVKRVKNLEDAFILYNNGFRNYLTRNIRVNGQYHTEYYDKDYNMFVETR